MNNFQQKLNEIKHILTAGNLDSESVDSVYEQLKLFIYGVKYPELLRPCSGGDGLVKLEESDHKKLLDHFNEAALCGRVMKFIPASGAASRMFQKLQSVLKKHDNLTLDEIRNKAADDQDCRATLEFLTNLGNFAFYDDLKSVLNCNDAEIGQKINESPLMILRTVMEESGLNYSAKPKGAIKFHKYPDESRTAFEEQVHESLHYLPDRHNSLRVHFTISEEHTTLFNQIVDNLKLKMRNTDFKLEVDFSYQKKSTHTIAVDINNNPIIGKDGTLLMRPAGHGALLENLNDLKADIVIIKNIDNLSTEDRAEATILYKKLLTGYLVEVQSKTFDLLNRLEKDEIDISLESDAFSLLEEQFGILRPRDFDCMEADKKKEYFFDKLNRPLRVCGMVKNTGEPGGGPFWVRAEDGGISKQIIDGAQINLNDESQKQIFLQSAHFNPVDIVCGIKDYKENNFDLLKFRDPASGVITLKYKDGIKIKALELPGLWNGSMAYWNTVFIEVPVSTFNPVKEINDLLRKEHQYLI